MTEQEIRFECLRMADTRNYNPESAVRAAERFFAFITGKSDDAEIVRAAKELAEKVKRNAEPADLTRTVGGFPATGAAPQEKPE